MVDEKKAHTSFSETIEGKREICYILYIQFRLVKSTELPCCFVYNMGTGGPVEKIPSYGEAYE
ncbi:hypothetical protein D5281_07310 [bacterium 1xD42-62]|uniref:Uncharacterized protein n=1 Tax=Parablautia muri TaxID=2320879 RepID=A0A9X5GRQ4_9FIRM|nr:hypothetical protein [Parablautia muri]